ncbi:MAG: CehA/McbA family metallohydrolase [Opitutaceae bacterium]|nr:CehA/McbA family metallohydrolase [Opitutaceae bacterium]
MKPRARRFLPPAIALLVAALACAPRASAHQWPHLFDRFPPAPPTIDPGPDAATLRIRLIEAATGKPTSASICVNNGNHEPDDRNHPLKEFSHRRHGNQQQGPIRLRDFAYAFYADGQATVRVRPGPVTIAVRKGYEYRPVEITLDAAAKAEIAVDVPLTRAIDMAALGWFSGDTHIHIERTGKNDDAILALTSAEDIRYAFLLSFNTKGYDAGVGYESHRQHTGVGEASLARRDVYHLTSGQEYRARRFGHVTIALADRYVAAGGTTDDVERGPSLGTIADQAHAARGFIALAHGGYFEKEADRLLLERKMDFLELLQFGEHRSLGLAGWYDFLNIGFRLPIIGACDYPTTQRLGSEITYAWSDTVPTPRGYAEALAAGRSFATSGPMLFLTVDGKKPGEILRFTHGTPRTLRLEARVYSPQHRVRFLDLIVNGKVVERRFDAAGRSEFFLAHLLPLGGSCWIAAHAHGDGGTEAHTNPVFAYVDDRHPFVPASARNILARLDGSAAAIAMPEVNTRIDALKAELQRHLRDGRSALPLPPIPP